MVINCFDHTDGSNLEFTVVVWMYVSDILIEKWISRIWGYMEASLRLLHVQTLDVGQRDLLVHDTGRSDFL